jgi:hypothetical protein
MWISDVYLKMHIDVEQPQRLAEAQCANLTARFLHRRRLLQRRARVQHELEAAEARDSSRRAPQPLADCP